VIGELGRRARRYAGDRPGTVALMGAAALVRIAFWAYTGRVWEDALITVTHARNAALGLGLVHHLGEGRVHGFTSALSVLVPLLGEVLRAGGGLVALRLASIGAAVLAVGFADALARDLELRRGPTFFALAYIAFERNQVFYGMAGMETEIAVAVLLGSVLALVRRRTFAGGVGLGLALLARPDFVLWVVPAIAAVLREDPRRGVRTALVGALVALPWFAFATAYYGSPIPHTIIAKAGVSPAVPEFGGADSGAWLAWIGERLALHRYDWACFAPFVNDGFAAAVPVPLALLEAIGLATIALGLAGIGATARGPWPWRAAGAYVVAFQAYRVALLAVCYYEWYLPPFTALFALEVAAGLTLLARRLPRAADALALALALATAATLPFTFAVERRIEREIEDPVRREVGLYLHSVVKEGESVACEPAGFLGYYGGVLLYDYPGLTSPTVRRALETVPRAERTLPRAIVLVQPSWLVLRPDELKKLVTDFPSTAVHYQLVRTFAVSDELGRVEWCGFAKDDYDTKYYVLARRAEAGAR
jgi:hypothetical protein